jgi:hypothetical protein
LKSGFGKARETYSMHVELAYARYVAAPVAMLAGDVKTSDGRAGRAAAADAVPAASDVRAAGTGRAVRSACRSAQSDSDRDNGARLAIDAFNAQGSQIGMHSTRHAARAGGVAIDRATGTRVPDNEPPAVTRQQQRASNDGRPGFGATQATCRCH